MEVNIICKILKMKIGGGGTFRGYGPGTSRTYQTGHEALEERTGMEIQSFPVAAGPAAQTTFAIALSLSDLYSTLCAQGR